MAGKGTPATLLLVRSGIAHTLHPYTDPPAGDVVLVKGQGQQRQPAYGEIGAAALGVDPARMYKTLLADLDGRLVCAVVPVSGSLDLKALAAALGGKKAAMADPAAAERSTGYVVGGISPLGQKTRLRTVVDASALGLETVHVSGGRRGLSLELAPADLISLTDAVVAGVAR